MTASARLLDDRRAVRGGAPIARLTRPRLFDTELLVLAQRFDLRIHEVPVDWTDDPDSRVAILAAAREDLAGIFRSLRGLGFSAGWSASAASAWSARWPTSSSTRASAKSSALKSSISAALLVTVMADTAANWWMTFGFSRHDGLLRHHVGGLAAFVIGGALTSGSLWLQHHSFSTPGRAVEVAIIVVAIGQRWNGPASSRSSRGQNCGDSLTIVLPQLGDVADVARLQDEGAALSDALRARVRELRNAWLVDQQTAAARLTS